MSKPDHFHPKVRKLVVVFDICSSTLILNDLIQTENQRKWADLLIRLKEFLAGRSLDHNFEIYKFLGDGYILIFNVIYNPSALLTFLREISVHFRDDYSRNIKRLLQAPPTSIGITFGVEAGSLMKLTMLNRREYVGRALNVASRLQNALKDKDKAPANKVLLASHYYWSMRHFILPWKGKRVRRDLRNIGTGIYCYKIELLPRVNPTGRPRTSENGLRKSKRETSKGAKSRAGH